MIMRSLCLFIFFLATLCLFIPGLQSHEPAQWVNRPEEPKAGEVIEYPINEKVKIKFCWIPSGKATLGSPKTEKLRARDNSEEEHEFTCTGLWMTKYEITQEEWMAVTGAKNPSRFASTGLDKDKVIGMDTSRFPVETVTAADAHFFCKRMMNRMDAAKYFGKPGRFTLPSNDEWEYAARGGKGNAQVFYWGDGVNGKEANIAGVSPYYGVTVPKGPYLRRTTTVGSYEQVAPHPWGLCDMIGNVSEWCEPVGSELEVNVKRNQRGGHYGANGGVARTANTKPGGMAGLRICYRFD